MKKVTILLPLLIGFMLGCKTNKDSFKIVSFEPIKSIELESEIGLSHHPSFYKTTGDSIYLTLTANQGLISYCLGSGKKIETVNINCFKPEELAAFNYHNADSIFLVFNSAAISPYNYHDSVFMMIDNTGEIKDIFLFNNLPVPATYNEMKPFDKMVEVPAPFQPIPFFDDKIFFTFYYYGHRMGDENFNNSGKRPLGGFYDLSANKFEIYQNIDSFPYVKKGQTYPPFNAIVFLNLDKTGNPIIGFAYTPMLYRYNVKTQKISKPRITTQLADTIKPVSVSRQYSDKSQAEFHAVYFDKYRNHYYRIVRLPVPKDATPYRKNNPKRSLIIADENYQTIAEGIIPDSVATIPFIIGKEGLWLRNIYNKNNMQYDLYNLVMQKGSKKELEKIYAQKPETELNSIGVQAYMKNFTNLPSNSSVLIVPTDLGCKSCANEITEFYTKNQALFADTSQYIVLAGVSNFTMKPFLQSHNISKDMPKLYVDDKGEYLKYLIDFNSPRLFIIENNNIIHDELYYPNDIFRLERQLKEYSQKKQ